MSFLIRFLHNLSAIWTGLLVLTLVLALFSFIHSHFHYSFILLSLIAFLLYGLASTVSLDSLSCHIHAQLSIGTWNLSHSHYYSLHFMSYHFSLVLRLICFMRKLPLLHAHKVIQPYLFPQLSPSPFLLYVVFLTSVMEVTVVTIFLWVTSTPKTSVHI
jgi:hypothetical protein